MIHSLALCLISLGTSWAQGHKLPPQAIVDVLDAARPPQVSLSPDKKWFVVLTKPKMPSLVEVMRPCVAFEGYRFDPKRRLPVETERVTGIRLCATDGSFSRDFPVVQDTYVAGGGWAPTSDRFVLCVEEDEALGLSVIDVAQRTLTPVNIGGALNLALGSHPAWLPGGTGLIVKRVPAVGVTPASPVPAEKPGPIVHDSRDVDALGSDRATSNAQSSEAARFEISALSELVEVSLTGTREPRLVGKAALYTRVSPSPDGDHLLVEFLTRPVRRVLAGIVLPSASEVWTREGQLERRIVDSPWSEYRLDAQVPVVPRRLEWQASAPSTLWACVALDGGDPEKPAVKRDRWMKLEWPLRYDSKPKTAFELDHRAAGLAWFEGSGLVVAYDYDPNTHRRRTLLFNLMANEESYRIIEDHVEDDVYGDSGDLVQDWLPNGTKVIRRDENFVYRIGEGASPEGLRPFLDRCDLVTGRAERLWRSEIDSFEFPRALLRSSASTKPTVLMRHETPEMASVRIHDLDTGKVEIVTQFPASHPALRAVEKRVIHYARRDGVQLSSTLYLPKDRNEKERLPLFIWAYPNEVMDAAVGGQWADSTNRYGFVAGASEISFALHGWAVIRAAMPVVGDRKTVNDFFIEQIVMNAEAAIDHAVSLEIADRNYCAVGGHSYGAFMAANLLAHSDLFKAGVCRSGMYNCTLSAFGFQSESRTLWEAPDLYTKLSAFLAADRINEPILLIHGEGDENMHAPAFESERMYRAVIGTGGTARLVILPGEGHTYRARESIMHTVAEMLEWCDRFVVEEKLPAKSTGPR